MARSEARIQTRIWDNDDFCSLTANAKLAYFTILSQNDLTLCGIIPHRPRRWAKKIGLPAGQLTRAIAVLDDARFTLTDELTDELLVRTFMRHDGIFAKPNIFKGAARAVAMVESERLLDTIVEEIPSPLRDGWPGWYRDASIDDIAKRMSDAGTTKAKPTPEPFQGTLPENGSGEPLLTTLPERDPAPTYLRPPSSGQPDNRPSSSSVGETHDPTGPDPDDDEQLRNHRRTEARTRAITEARTRAGGDNPIRSVGRYTETVYAELVAEGWTPSTTEPNWHTKPAEYNPSAHLPDAATVMDQALAGQPANPETAAAALAEAKAHLGR